MGRKIFVVSLLISFILFAFNACSINWGEPETQTVDQMLGGGDEGAAVPLPPQTPHSSSAAQIGTLGNDILSMPLNSAQLNETQWFSIGLTQYNQGRYNSFLQAYNKVIVDQSE